MMVFLNILCDIAQLSEILINSTRTNKNIATAIDNEPYKIIDTSLTIHGFGELSANIIIMHINARCTIINPRVIIAPDKSFKNRFFISPIIPFLIDLKEAWLH